MANQAITENIAWGVTNDQHNIWEMFKGHKISLFRRKALYCRTRAIVVHDRALRELTK